MATSFLSDSSQDSICSSGRSPKSPGSRSATGGEDVSPPALQHSQEPQCFRMSSRPPKAAPASEAAAPLLQAGRRAPEQSCSAAIGTEAYFIGTPPGSGRFECRHGAAIAGRSAVASNAAAHTAAEASTLDFGASWASPRDSLRPGHRPPGSSRGPDIFVPRNTGISAADPFGMDSLRAFGRQPPSASGSTPSASSRRGRPPPVLASSARAERSSSNSSVLRVRTAASGLHGKSTAPLSDLRAAAAAIGLSARGPAIQSAGSRSARAKSQECPPPRGNSTEPASDKSTSHFSRRQSPHSRSSSTMAPRSPLPSQSMEQLTSRAQFAVRASGQQNSRSGLEVTARPPAAEGTGSDFMPKAIVSRETGQSAKSHACSNSSHCASCPAGSEHTPQRRVATRDSTGTSSSEPWVRPADDMRDRSREAAAASAPKARSAMRASSSASSLTGQRGVTGKPGTGLNPRRAPREGSSSVPTPGSAHPPWAASCPAPGGKHAPLTPQRGRAGATPPSARKPDSVMRALLTHRCPSLTRRLGL